MILAKKYKIITFTWADGSNMEPFAEMKSNAKVKICCPGQL